MQITFSPVRIDETLALSVDGDVLTVNGATLDLGGRSGWRHLASRSGG